MGLRLRLRYGVQWEQRQYLAPIVHRPTPPHHFTPLHSTPHTARSLAATHRADRPCRSGRDRHGTAFRSGSRRGARPWRVWSYQSSIKFWVAALWIEVGVWYRFRFRAVSYRYALTSSEVDVVDGVWILEQELARWRVGTVETTSTSMCRGSWVRSLWSCSDIISASTSHLALPTTFDPAQYRQARLAYSNACSRSWHRLCFSVIPCIHTAPRARAYRYI